MLMKKSNKKGLTLIEMLVVIAIIAILVAIIVPIVSTATKKAAAATNAANLRSYLAETVNASLTGGNVTSNIKSKKCGDVAADLVPVVNAEMTDAAFVASGTTTYPTSGTIYNIDYFAKIAGGTDSTTPNPSQQPGG